MSFIQNEPNAAKRKVPVFLVAPAAAADGSGVGGQVGIVTIKVSKNGGNWVAADAGTAITEVTGGVAGSYTLAFAVGDWDTAGLLQYQIAGPNTRLFQSEIMLDPNETECLRYFMAQAGGDATHIKMDAAASATDSYYAGGGKNCIALVEKGTGAGQAALAIGYVGATKLLALAAPGILGGTDATSIVRLVPFEGVLDTATITAIQTGLATAASLTTVSGKVDSVQADTDDIQTRLTTLAGLMHLNTMVDNVTYGSQNLLTLWRLRAFDTKAHLDAATPGNVAVETGEIARFAGSAVDVGSGQWSSTKLSQTYP